MEALANHPYIKAIIANALDLGLAVPTGAELSKTITDLVIDNEFRNPFDADLVGFPVGGVLGAGYKKLRIEHLDKFANPMTMAVAKRIGGRVDDIIDYAKRVPEKLEDDNLYREPLKQEKKTPPDFNYLMQMPEVTVEPSQKEKERLTDRAIENRQKSLKKQLHGENKTNTQKKHDDMLTDILGDD